VCWGLTAVASKRPSLQPQPLVCRPHSWGRGPCRAHTSKQRILIVVSLTSHIGPWAAWCSSMCARQYLLTVAHMLRHVMGALRRQRTAACTWEHHMQCSWHSVLWSGGAWQLHVQLAEDHCGNPGYGYYVVRCPWRVQQHKVCDSRETVLGGTWEGKGGCGLVLNQVGLAVSCSKSTQLALSCGSV